jgi:hypothetical protein
LLYKTKKQTIKILIIMIFSKHSAVMQLLESADEIELIFRGINIPNRLGNHRSVYYGIQDLDKPHIIFMSEDLNEPKDLSFYSDRFISWTSENLRKDIEEQVGCSVFSSNIWFNREKATKAIELYCLANRMMAPNDKIVVTGIIRLVNRSNGYPYFYILYRVESTTAKE